MQSTLLWNLTTNRFFSITKKQQLQQYGIEVIHISGKNILSADTLSRNFVSDTFSDFTEGLELHKHTVINSMPISDMKIEQIRLATQNDSQLKTLKGTLLDG
jgi:hypothetical protein